MFSANRRILTAFVLTASLVLAAFGQHAPRPRTEQQPASAQAPRPATSPAPAQQAAPEPATQPRLATPQAVAPSAMTPQAAVEPQQSRPPQPQAQPAQTAPPAAPRQPDYVEEKGFKNKVFELKHREANSLALALRPLGSGFKGATISPNGEFKILTVRDFPENIAAIEEALKRLDVPEAVSPDIEFIVHVLIASNGDQPVGDLPQDLVPVVKQLQSTLKYKNYGLMTSGIHRGKEGPRPASNSGIAESKLLGITTPQGNPIFYSYRLSGISLDGIAGSSRVQISEFNFSMRAPLVIGPGGAIQYENIGFNTPVTVREGEKVVVGTTSMGDKGLIVVLSAKLLK